MTAIFGLAAASGALMAWKLKSIKGRLLGKGADRDGEIGKPGNREPEN